MLIKVLDHPRCPFLSHNAVLGLAGRISRIEVSGWGEASVELFLYMKHSDVPHISARPRQGRAKLTSSLYLPTYEKISESALIVLNSFMCIRDCSARYAFMSWSLIAGIFPMSE